MSKVDADKWLKGKMIQLAAKKREIADRLTNVEKDAIAKKEASNYQGKAVTIDSKGVQVDGVVVGMSFGKVRVKLADGSVVSVSPDNVQARKAAPPTEKPVAYTAAQQAPASSVEAPKFTPDTADLRQVREFGRELVEPAFTQEPPTAPLARGRQRITPFHQNHVNFRR